MEKVALVLIDTGKSRPEQITNDKGTALSWAIGENLKKVAVKLINTGKSHPEQISINKNTALIKACKNKMTDVSLKLLDSCKSTPSYSDKVGFTALYWVNKNNLSLKLKTKLLEMIEKCKRGNYTKRKGKPISISKNIKKTIRKKHIN